MSDRIREAGHKYMLHNSPKNEIVLELRKVLRNLMKNFTKFMIRQKNNMENPTDHALFPVIAYLIDNLLPRRRHNSVVFRALLLKIRGCGVTKIHKPCRCSTQKSTPTPTFPAFRVAALSLPNGQRHWPPIPRRYVPFNALFSAIRRRWRRRSLSVPC